MLKLYIWGLIIYTSPNNLKFLASCRRGISDDGKIRFINRLSLMRAHSIWPHSICKMILHRRTESLINFFKFNIFLKNMPY